MEPERSDCEVTLDMAGMVTRRATTIASAAVVGMHIPGVELPRADPFCGDLLKMCDTLTARLDLDALRRRDRVIET